MTLSVPLDVNTPLNSTTRTRPKSSPSYTPLFDHPAGVMFLDIETTGLSKYYDYITLIGYELNGEYRVLLAGDDDTQFRNALATAKSLVTFNGSSFDLPFIDAFYDDLLWPKHHVDLRYACRRIGLVGGQKKIEQELRISVREGFEGVDGAMAVILWHRYLRGDRGALRELIEYNRADIRAMSYILDHVVEAAAPTDLLTRTRRLYSFCAAPDVRKGIAQPEARLPDSPNELKRSATFDELFSGSVAEDATIVGLDLTGSAKRPSGFCKMVGKHAETKTLGDDDEIVEQVLRAQPNLVSIDSPLCLPVGRTKVTDDDPERHLGIMRESERMLKRRGINVYPCLIPSMQRLTERGIRLAERIRSHGIPVIECYPGAAQDIMGIPRKGAGKEWLSLGLDEFGIEGEFRTADLTHDELDAITCSLVGFFHLAGQTEALGGKGEEPMIVPDLKATKRSVIGISGPISAGKTTAARFLEGRGFAYTRISLVIDDVLNERGEELTRDNQQRVGLELHESKGQRWLCARAIDRLEDSSSDIVIDGLRWTEDVVYLAERYGGQFCHIHILAALDVRRARAERNGRAEEFANASAHEVESGVAELAELAAIQIRNEGEIDTFKSLLAEQLVEREKLTDAS